jgi:hypothetical protein
MSPIATSTRQRAAKPAYAFGHDLGRVGVGEGPAPFHLVATYGHANIKFAIDLDWLGVDRHGGIYQTPTGCRNFL